MSAAEEPTRIRWSATKLGDVSSDRIWPAIGQRDDKQCLLYSGAINMLFGESGSAKSWVAQTIAKQECDAGHYVVFIDYESQAQSIKGRLASLGMSEKSMGFFIYISAPGSFDEAARAWLDKLVGSFKPTLLIIDSAGESQAMEDDSGAPDVVVTRWRKKLPEHYAQRGLCVLEIDHSGVSWENRTRVAGSFRKKAGLTGISLQTVPVTGQPHARGKEGRTKIVCRKDREGTYANGEVAAIFVHKDHLNGTHGWVELRTPTEDDLKPNAAREPKKMLAARAMQDYGLDGDDLSIRDVVTRLDAIGLTFSIDAVGKAKKLIADHAVTRLEQTDSEAA